MKYSVKGLLKYIENCKKQQSIHYKDKIWPNIWKIFYKNGKVLKYTIECTKKCSIFNNNVIFSCQSYTENNMQIHISPSLLITEPSVSGLCRYKGCFCVMSLFYYF